MDIDEKEIETNIEIEIDMKMKRLTKLAVMAMVALLPSMEMNAQDWKSFLSGIASEVGEKVAEKAQDKLQNFSVTGRWTYVKPDCRLESENAVLQAGTEFAANRIEQRIGETLKKFGLDEKSVFTFNSDSTYTFTYGTRSTQGTYSLNMETKEIIMTSRFQRTFTAKVVKNVLDPNKMSLLFNADKLVAFAQDVTGMLMKKASSRTVNAANALLKQYNGMMLGFELSNGQQGTAKGSEVSQGSEASQGEQGK